uniref:Uncharacterized protein n=1 Tax=Nelumbo nucifera TaxID=4432 RepID=A0A822XD83_NELNU|nr:TPA_asm: hypothetical protein HUJ06_020857 [Nelumbo nucifera]
MVWGKDSKKQKEREREREGGRREEEEGKGDKWRGKIANDRSQREFGVETCSHLERVWGRAERRRKGGAAKRQNSKTMTGVRGELRVET